MRGCRGGGIGSREACEKLERRHHSMFHARRPRCARAGDVFHPVRHNAIPEDPQPSECHGRSCAITATSLALCPGVGHAPPRTARAYAPVLAREGHEQIMTTVVAVRANEAVREHAASKVGTKLPLHVGRKRLVVRLGRVTKERGKVPLHHAVERSLRWPPRSVCRREGSHNNRAAKPMPALPEVFTRC
jgi:hypothetical protein